MHYSGCNSMEDWSDSDWLKATDHSISFVRNILKDSNQHEAFEAFWGRSIRGQTHPKSKDLSAQSVQLHAAVRQEKLGEVLRLSGFNRIFLTPKGEDGRPSPEWRIVWLEGSLAHLTSMSTQTEHCAGLTRNRNSWGLRFPREHFEKAWAVLCASKPLPTNLQMKYLYRVEPLPFGATASMLQQWSTVLGWPFKALKAMGPKTWLLGSQEPCPSGVICFNVNPVILKLIPPRTTAQANAVLAGPRPRRDTGNQLGKGEDPLTVNDPWAASLKQQSSGTAVPQAARSVHGPIEAKFSEHSQRMDKFEEALAQLRSETQQGFAKVEEREKSIHTSITQVKQELENSMKQGFAQQSTQLNATLTDIRNLMIVRNKRTKADDEEDDKMDGE